MVGVLLRILVRPCERERIHIIHIIQCLPCVKGELARVGGDGNLELCVRLLFRSNRSVLQHVLENKKKGRKKRGREEKNTIKKYIYINCDLEALVWVFTCDIQCPSPPLHHIFRQSPLFGGAELTEHAPDYI